MAIATSSASAIRDGVLAVAERSAQHRRLYLREHYGVSPAEIFAELAPMLAAEVLVRSADPSAEAMPVGAVRRGNVLVIPYLVDEEDSLVPRSRNRGLRGYAGTLRTDFAQEAAPGDIHVLLVLDAEPFETILTAAEDAGELHELHWSSLILAIGGSAAGPGADVVRMVANDLVSGHAGNGRGLLDEFGRFATYSWPSSREAGMALPSLGCYLADPRPSEDRLRASAAWRRNLELWSLPDRDLVGELARHSTSEDAGAEKILRAYGPFGLDFNAFTFDDLPSQRDQGRLELVLPLQLSGARAAASTQDACAVWIGPESPGFSLTVTGSEGSKKPTVLWHGGAMLECEVDEDSMALRIPVPPARPGTSWNFGTVLVRRGVTVEVAAFRGSGTWFPVERALRIDPLAGCFRVLDVALADAIGPGGRVLGDAPVELDSDDSEEVQQALARFGGEALAIPVMVESLRSPDLEADQDPSGEEGDSSDRLDTEIPDDADAGGEEYPDEDGIDGEREPEQGAAYGTVSSAAHAVLDLAASRRLAGASFDHSPPVLSQGARKLFTVEPSVHYELEPQRLAPDIDGLDVEARIIELGVGTEALAFAQVRQQDGSLAIAPDHALNRLRLDALDPSLIGRFWQTRRAFLASISEAGTAHALLCGIGVGEAEAYVDAYLELLRSVGVGGRYSRELDRILLADLVSSEDGTQCWLAPTNPVTVAWALELVKELPALATGDLPERDSRALSPRYLLPLFHANGGWWEVDDQQIPLLWRRYRPLGSTMALTGGNHRTIIRRLEKFLRIFPAYNDPRQHLAITFREPGDGSSVAEALRAFYASELVPGAKPARPRLDVTVYTESGDTPEKLLELMAPDSKQDRDQLVQSRVRLATLRTCGDQAFAHICFAFRTPTARRPRETRIDDRCATDWVGGLAPAIGRTATQSPNELAFTSGLFLAPGDGRRLQALMERTLELVGGQPDKIINESITQATTTVLNAGDLDAVQRNSVWTVHADRLLGLEAFSYQLGERKAYIVDFEDRTSVWQAGLDSVTVTERVDPYRTALGRAFGGYAHLDAKALPPLIDYANAVSGSWNLDLLNAPPNGLRERLGFLAAIAMLKDMDRAFSHPSVEGSDLGGVLLPLDELFRLLPRSGFARPSGRSCDDLIYLRLFEDGDGIWIGARLIEVKFKTAGLPDLATASKEIQRTRSLLDEVARSDSATRPFRARDLAEYVRSGAIRNRTFGLDGIDGGQIENIARRIGSGNYRIDFSYLADEERVHGDIVSLELENTVVATRTVLAGADGLKLGYVRLGQPVLGRLAAGGALDQPEAWPAIRFTPEDGGPDRQSGWDLGSEPSGPLATTLSRHVGAEPRPAGASGPTADESSEARSQGEADGARLAAEISSKASELDRAAAKYGLQLGPFEVRRAQAGPSVIRFRTRLLGRESIANVRKRALDLGREVGFADGLIIDQEPYFITVDVPRSEPETVKLADHLDALARVEAPGALPFLLGMAPSGEAAVEDLARLPHLLVAGATGSGKSVLLRGILCCLARARSPMQLQIMIVDPKGVDFMPFEDLMHLVGSRVITDPPEAVKLLSETLEREVSWRRSRLSAAGVTSALEFYESGGTLEELPQMVILVDEFADLAASLDRAARESFLTLIQRFGQLTRAFGIYLILATQRPSVQVITGDIKANLTARVAMKVQSAVDSTTILGRGGAEALRPGGDLIFDHGGQAKRLQAFYAGPADVREAKSFWIAG